MEPTGSELRCNAPVGLFGVPVCFVRARIGSSVVWFDIGGEAIGSMVNAGKK